MNDLSEEDLDIVCLIEEQHRKIDEHYSKSTALLRELYRLYNLRDPEKQNEM